MLIPVPPEAAGVRIDAFLASYVGSRARAQALLAAGAVELDGRTVAKRQLLAEGQTITVSIEVAADPAPPPEDEAPFVVAWEDEHLLIVDKPAGVVVHPARGHRTGTLAQALASRGAAGGDPCRAGIVHRLDRDTSGLLVVARSALVHRRLRDALSRREIVREYLALVAGAPPARSGTIDAPIGRDRRDRTRVSIDTDVPREARTHFTLERRLPDAALLRLRLETGRTHQIRAHLAAIGAPICGDPDYGVSGAYGLRRQFLHATHLELRHPVSGTALAVDSPLPEDLVAALAEAEASGR